MDDSSKCLAVTLFLIFSTSNLAIADPLKEEAPSKPTLMVMAALEETPGVQFETVAAIPDMATAEKGFPTLSTMFDRIPFPTPKPDVSVRTAPKKNSVLTNYGKRGPQYARSITVRAKSTAVTPSRRVALPMPPIIGVFR